MSANHDAEAAGAWSVGIRVGSESGVLVRAAGGGRSSAGPGCSGFGSLCRVGPLRAAVDGDPPQAGRAGCMQQNGAGDTPLLRRFGPEGRAGRAGPQPRVRVVFSAASEGEEPGEQGQPGPGRVGAAAGLEEQDTRRGATGSPRGSLTKTLHTFSPAQEVLTWERGVRTQGS